MVHHSRRLFSFFLNSASSESRWHSILSCVCKSGIPCASGVSSCVYTHFHTACDIHKRDRMQKKRIRKSTFKIVQEEFFKILGIKNSRAFKKKKKMGEIRDDSRYNITHPLRNFKHVIIWYT